MKGAATEYHMQRKEVFTVFLRINNRKKKLTIEDFIKAGYPVVVNQSSKWKELHDLCKATFCDGQGRLTYTWFGEKFVFLNDEDANVFRALQLIA